MLFALNVKMIKGAAHKNGKLDGTCKGAFNSFLLEVDF